MSNIKFEPNGHFGINGITIHPGSDVDADLVTVDVTGTPVFKWDESESKFSINTGLNIIGSSDIVQQVTKAFDGQTVNIKEFQDDEGNTLSGADERGILFSDGGTDPTNVFIGSDAGNKNASGAIDNIGIGSCALLFLTSGDGLIAIGTDALERNTSGGSSIGIGFRAGKFNGSGNSNTYVGTEAGVGSSGNSNNANVGLGSKSLTSIRTGDNNVALGVNAGRLLTTGNSNIFLGANAGRRQTTLSNLLIVDNQIRADIATELTNSILYGVMAATPAAQTLRINAVILGPHGAKIGDGGATNYLNVSNTGVVTLLGSAKRWLAMRPDLDYTVITAQGKPTQVVVGVFHGYSMPVYAAGQNEELFFNIHVPGRWDEASNPIVHLLVALAGAEDVNDNFKFQISWEHLTEEDAISVTSHDVEVEQAVLTDRNAQYSTYELQFTIDYDVDTPDNLADHDDLAFRLRRIDATNPDITNEVIILDYHVEFRVDKMFDGDAI